MKKIELFPIREWEEKEKNKPTGNIRIYIGKLQVGTCFRKNKQEELYSFHSFYFPITERMNTSEYRPLHDIKIDIECYYKEFATKWIKSVKTYTPVIGGDKI